MGLVVAKRDNVIRLDRWPAVDQAELTFEEMLTGWRNQMLARNLSLRTITSRERLVRRFVSDLNVFPWLWTPGMLDEWLGDFRSLKGAARSTIRAYGICLRGFCRYLVDPVYGWQEVCEERFGTYPVQIAHEWNTAVHVQESGTEEPVRPFTQVELQAFFDCADGRVARAQRLGRKGWVAAFRDATAFKTAYAWWLRRNEVAMLDVTDFGMNPRAPEFGARGVLYVRHGKAMKGSPPKQRSVLTVFGWAVECIDEWVSEVRPELVRLGAAALWPTERGQRLGRARLGDQFRDIRAEAGLPTTVTLHSLRRSYVTHLIEAGFDARFVQEQVGHEHASTTSLYTSVSSDYRTRSLRSALDRVSASLLNTGASTSKGQP